MVIVMAMTAVTATAVAAPKSKKKTTTTEFYTDIDCEGCVKKVMNFMPFQKGIKNVDVELEKKMITVEYDSRKTNDEAIIKSFERIDVHASLHAHSEGECAPKGCC